MSLDAHAIPAAPVRRASSRQWWGLAVLALPCLLYSMDLTVLNLAIPQLTADLDPTAVQQLWIVDIYGFLLAGALITMGALGDRIGRRQLLLIGATAFGIASVLAAFAPTAELLIAARALLGLAAATLAPSTLSLIRTMFEDERQRSFAIGVWIASFSVGAAIGPLVGGLLLEVFWWGSVFLISVPVMVLLLIVGPFILPEHREGGGARIDLVSAAISLAAMLSLVYGIKHAAAGGLDALAAGAIIVGLALGAVFVRRQSRLATPMINLALFRSRRFSVSLVVNLASFFVAFGTFLFLAQYLQLVVGLSPFEAGVWTLISAAGFIGGSFSAPALLSKFQSATIMAASLVVAAAGFAALVLALGSGSFAMLMTGCFVLSVGLAHVFTLSTDTIVGAAPEEMAGSAAALAETSSELGGALGIAVLGSIVVGAYRETVAQALPGGLADGLAAALNDSIGAGVDALSAAEAGIAAPLREIVTSAYSGAFAEVMMISIAVSLATALVALTLRRRSA